MVRRFVILCCVLLATMAAAHGQETVAPSAIPEPNEVIEQKPQPEAMLVPATAENAPGDRFGGEDGVFRFVVVGDGLAVGLGAGLERLTELDPRFEVVNRAKANSGVARPEIYDWPLNIPKFLKASSFDAVVVLMGANDIRAIKVGEARVEPGTPEWSTAYKANVDRILATIKENGARAYWVTLPPMQKPEFDAQMQVVSGLQRERVVTAGVALIDIKGVLSNADGSYMIGDLDAKGKIRTLRSKDGISFTRQGNDFLAGLVMAAIRKAEKVPDLQSVKDDPLAVETQVAVAVPSSASPLFGQQGVDGADMSFEADVLAKEQPQKITPDLSNAGKLGLRISRNSLAQRFYRTGEALGVPYGRFDDFSVSGPTP